MRLLVVTLVIFFLLISTTKADDFDCLVEALYHEARSESLLGMLSVANVILTRKGSTHYHASYVTPRWASNSYFKSLGQLGNHIFYIDTTP